MNLPPKDSLKQALAFQIVDLENGSRDKQIEVDRLNNSLEKVQGELTTYQDLLEVRIRKPLLKYFYAAR